MTGLGIFFRTTFPEWYLRSAGDSNWEWFSVQSNVLACRACQSVVISIECRDPWYSAENYIVTKFSHILLFNQSL